MTDFRYTPRSVATIKLHARTMAPATIATVMRCSVGTIELICRKHAIEMRESDLTEPSLQAELTRAQRKTAGTQVEICVDRTSFTMLASEARRRGTSTRDLISLIVEAVADDKMVGAVLDR